MDPFLSWGTESLSVQDAAYGGLDAPNGPKNNVWNFTPVGQARSEAANEELRALRLFVGEEAQRQIQARLGISKILLMVQRSPVDVVTKMSLFIGFYMLHWHPQVVVWDFWTINVISKKLLDFEGFLCLHILLQIWHIVLILGESLVLECIGYAFFSWNHLSEAAMEASRAEASEREHRLSSKLMTQAQAFGVGWVGKGCRNGKSQLTGWIWKEMTGSWRMNPAWWWFQVIFQVGWNHQPACIWPGYN